MRTTKAIREYVKGYIQKSYEPKIKECYGDYKKRKYAAWDAICEYESEVNQHIREIIQDCNLSFDDVENFCSFNISGGWTQRGNRNRQSRQRIERRTRQKDSGNIAFC